jgi:Outer membrane protein beta-barrel domain
VLIFKSLENDLKFDKFFLLLLLLPSISFTQTNFSLGVIGGLNITHLDGDLWPNSKKRTGVSVGVTSQLNLMNNFGFTLELIYASKGQVNDPTSRRTSMIKNYYYLSLPIFANYSFYKSNNLEIVAEFGSELSYLLDSKWEYYIDDRELSENVDPITAQFDFSVVLGSKLLIPVFYYKIFLGFRYGHGLVEVNTKPEIYGSVHNRVFSINSGIYF